MTIHNLDLSSIRALLAAVSPTLNLQPPSGIPSASDAHDPQGTLSIQAVTRWDRFNHEDITAAMDSLLSMPIGTQSFPFYVAERHIRGSISLAFDSWHCEIINLMIHHLLSYVEGAEIDMDGFLFGNRTSTIRRATRDGDNARGKLKDEWEQPDWSITTHQGFLVAGHEVKVCRWSSELLDNVPDARALEPLAQLGHLCWHARTR
ncbi:Uu.00g127500.m01.CDS01 [Anthostomella pinea]|uniref:Uu.00g127500.m01.CDS01 n=1 Tax=Anthostomella pinea TaxID=933095 RepID=A0AAI8YHX0_9PEZI|nr:Uu.00g127500.m01.CDS01 [Anthostomella pinea]